MTDKELARRVEEILSKEPKSGHYRLFLRAYGEEELYWPVYIQDDLLGNPIIHRWPDHDAICVLGDASITGLYLIHNNEFVKLESLLTKVEAQ